MNDYTYVLLATGFISIITIAFASKIEETKMQLFLNGTEKTHVAW